MILLLINLEYCNLRSRHTGFSVLPKPGSGLSEAGILLPLIVAHITTYC